MNKADDGLWQAFEAMARTYPHDNGVRITADLARWLVEQRERLQIPVPPVLQDFVRKMSEEIAAPDR